MPKLTRPPEDGDWFYYTPTKGVDQPFFRWFSAVLGSFWAASLLFTLVVSLIPLVRSLFSSARQIAYDSLGNLGFVAWGALILLVGFSFLFLTGRDIVVTEEVVWVGVLKGKGLAVNREAMRTATIFPVPFLDPTGKKRSYVGHSYAVRVEGLTPFHRFVGLMHGLWLRPVFIITPDHEDYEALLDRVRLMAGYDNTTLAA